MLQKQAHNYSNEFAIRSKAIFCVLNLKKKSDDHKFNNLTYKITYHI